MHLCRACAEAAFAGAAPDERIHVPRTRQRRRPSAPRRTPEQVREDWLRRSIDAFSELYQAFRGLAFHEFDSGALSPLPTVATSPFFARDERVVARTHELLEVAGPIVCAALSPRHLAPVPAPAPASD
jgi:hypothetical protein